MFSLGVLTTSLTKCPWCSLIHMQFDKWTMNIDPNPRTPNKEIKLNPSVEIFSHTHSIPLDDTLFPLPWSFGLSPRTHTHTQCGELRAPSLLSHSYSALYTNSPWSKPVTHARAHTRKIGVVSPYLVFQRDLSGYASGADDGIFTRLKCSKKWFEIIRPLTTTEETNVSTPRREEVNKQLEGCFFLSFCPKVRFITSNSPSGCLKSFPSSLFSNMLVVCSNYPQLRISFSFAVLRTPSIPLPS